MSVIAIASIVYGLAAIVALRPLAGHIAWTFWRNKYSQYPYSMRDAPPQPNGEQWSGGYLVAACLLVFWPAVAIAAVAGRLGPKVGAEKREESKRRKAYIKKLERELGIDP